MQDALNEFHGTAEEIRISITNADLAINRGDIEGKGNEGARGEARGEGRWE